MHKMHIKAHYVKPWTKTTVSKNFSNRYTYISIRILSRVGIYYEKMGKTFSL